MLYNSMGGKNSFIILLLIAASATITYCIESFQSSGNRQPASIPRVFDVSELSGSALEVASQKALLNGVQSIEAKENFGLTLGHFMTKGLDGRTDLVCRVYDRVRLTFQAEGMAVSGDRPSLTIEAPCKASANINQMETIWIPVTKIQEESPGDFELKYIQPTEMTLKFNAIPGAWPQYWVLSSLRVYNREDGRGIDLDARTIYQLSAHPISMRW